MLKRILLTGSMLLSPSLCAQTATNIAYLRTLVDSVIYAPIDTTNRYTAEGVVTTHTNLTTAGNALFYIQDNTAGISVFVGGGSTVRPDAGDLVRVTGPLGHFNGLLEFNLSASNTNHSVLTLSSNNPLPTPTPFEFSWQNDPAAIEPYEGGYVMASNVFLDLSTSTFPTGGGNVTVTNEAGETFVLRVDARTDINGQAKPTGPVTILGVLGQFDSTSPFTTGYQLLPSRYADILSASKAPTVRFTNVLELIRLGDSPTNTFTEHALLPGEKLVMSVEITDPEGRQVTITAPTNGLPAGARWALNETTGTNLSATFTFQAVASDAGSKYFVTLDARNSVATNNAAWAIYVPTADEQKVTVSEFLANPATTNTAPHFNPLRRVDLPPNPGTDDEYVELANVSGSNLELQNWTIADAVQVRHRFYDLFTLPASNSVVVYGGPLNGFAPMLDVPFIPASENVFGFGLNNSGGDSIIVRNAASNIISRVVYTDRIVSGTGSSTRFPDLNGAFVQQVWVSTNNVSPGRQYDGRLFSEPPAPLLSISNVTVSLTSSNTASLSWLADTSRSYTVWQADEVTDRFGGRFYGLRFTNEFGQFIDSTASNAPVRFYFISAP